MSQLADWKCHKVVKAGKLIAQQPDDPGEPEVILTVEDQNGAPCKVGVPRDFFARKAPNPGDYIVIYEDGYKSWSPASTFEAGYSRM
jgi:hypothetical protein